MAGSRSTAIVCLAMIFCVASAVAAGQTVTTLVSFDGNNGVNPLGVLLQGSDGNLYGSASSGGASVNYGLIFEVSPSGVLNTLYNFCAQTNCTDGASSYAGLVKGPNGNYYGTTYYGGDNCVSSNFHSGCGTVFEVTPDGTYSTIYSFCALGSGTVCSDGANPYAALLLGSDGNFYGTTESGGSNASDINCLCNGFGTVFKLTPGGELTTLYNFCNQMSSTGGCVDGALPMGTLVQGSNGNLYGTTGTGGRLGGGTIYIITPNGKMGTLYNFCAFSNCTDGSYPDAGLVAGPNGNFYGVASGGGYMNRGTVFAISPTGKLKTLHRFSGTDGTDPQEPLWLAADGNFYGTSGQGGANFFSGKSYGTLFKITPTGEFTSLYSFCMEANCTDGSYPYSGLMQAADGNFYGVTNAGGSANDGTVFRLSLN